MLIRPYTDADFDALRLAHASQGFAYPFPDLRDPIFVSKLVLEGDAGQVVMASLARLTCELYLLMDRDASESSSAGNPQERFARLLALHQAGEKDLLARWTTRTHGCRRPSPSASAAGLQNWVGSATTLGRPIVSGCEPTRNNNLPTAEAHHHTASYCAGPGLTGTHHKSIAQ